MRRRFRYYLHDDASSMERVEHIEAQIGERLRADVAENIGRPFYEVALECDIDTDTGEVRLLRIARD